jgi:predicted Zn-dependent protease
MGHLLGIIGHSSRTDVLMGPVFHDAPSIVDVNTLIRAYCHDKS